MQIKNKILKPKSCFISFVRSSGESYLYW